VEKLPEDLTQADYRFLSRTSQGKSNNLTDEAEELDWPREITEDDRKEVMRRLRKALSRWVADAGGETVGEDYIVINKEEVDGGTLTSTISIHNLAMMFAKLILRLESSMRDYPNYLGTGISPSQNLQDFAEYSEEQAYGLEEYIRKSDSFFSHLVEHPNSS